MTPWWEILGHPGGADLSACQRYRYLLWRTIPEYQHRAPLVFGMLNPSTANVTANDPTIRRCLGFARREQAGGIVVVNLCAWRATDPRDLERAHDEGCDVVGPENHAAWLQARTFGPIILAWGSGIRPWMDSAARHARQVAGLGEALCLGRTKRGEPRHPLMLRNDTPIEVYG